MSIPPQPSDIRYDDLKTPAWREKVLALIGYALSVGLFFSYIPFIMAISSVTNFKSLQKNLHWVNVLATRFPPAELLLEGIFSTLALVLFMSFLPDVLMFIFSNFFSIKANGWGQLRLQKWYFCFMFVFVLLITAISGSFIQRLREVVWNPPAVFSLLANSLPEATHFYLNFMIMQWAVHCLQITRYYNIFVYLGLRTVLEPDRAVELSEPEPQAYEGIGGRSARFTLNLVIALVFSTLSPVILPLTFINFLISRIFYGYLITFAETRKNDLGGQFFVQQLWHVQYGLILYVLLMCGVLAKHGDKGHVVICALSFLYLFYSMHRFSSFAWESLPFAEWCTEEAVAGAMEELERYRSLGKDKPCYTQPELCEEKWKVTGKAHDFSFDVKVVEPKKFSEEDATLMRARRLSAWASNDPRHSVIYKEHGLSTQIYGSPRLSTEKAGSASGSERPAGSSRKNVVSRPTTGAQVQGGAGSHGRRRSGHFGA